MVGDIELTSEGLNRLLWTNTCKHRYVYILNGESAFSYLSQETALKGRVEQTFLTEKEEGDLSLTIISGLHPRNSFWDNSRAFDAKVVVLTLKVVALTLKVVVLTPKVTFWRWMME